MNRSDIFVNQSKGETITNGHDNEKTGVEMKQLTVEYE